jgi:hypothetical protein
VPALTLGWEVVHWASKYLRHPNGPRAGKRWEFTDSQLLFLLHWYAVNEDGGWLYQHGVRRLVKGSGKSPFAALVALAELTAPVRLLDFDPKATGGVVGKPVSMPLVQIAATNESQTANTMRMVRAMAPKGSRIVNDFGLDPGKTKYYSAAEGTLEIITSSAAGAEGAEATFIVGDETEHWTESRGGPEFASTLQDNLAKSGSRFLETCNAWLPGVNSVAEESWEAWLAQEEGRAHGGSPILYDARIAPHDTPLYEDDEALMGALEHVYGDCWWVDLPVIFQRIRSPKAKPDDSRRKYLNQPTAADDAWTTAAEWAKLADSTKVVADGDEVVLFFDGSRSRDATALIGCRVEDGHVFTLGVWEPDPRHDVADQVDPAEVDATVRKAFDRYTVVGFFSDVREWESFARITWPAAFADQLAVHAVPGGKSPEAIAWDMRGHLKEFTLSAELTEAEIAEGAFTHDGDSRLARHVANARRKHNAYGVTIRKESRDSPLKIDAAVCLIGVRHLLRLVRAAAPKKKRSGVVY